MRSSTDIFWVDCKISYFHKLFHKDVSLLFVLNQYPVFHRPRKTSMLYFFVNE